MATNTPSGKRVRPSPTVDWADGTGRVPASTVAWLADQSSAAVARLWGRSAAHPKTLPHEGEIRVRMVSDAEMAAAHERYAKARGTTDVLTFDLTEGGDAVDVDILVCLDEAERQAGERGHEAWRELLLYAVHGMLHCLGHDDHDPAASERMHRLEDEVLTAIGVGPVFGAAEPRDGAP